MYDDSSEYTFTNLRLKTEVIDISDYSYTLSMPVNEKTDTSTVFQGKSGSYEIIWENQSTTIPKITVKLNDIIIIEQDMGKYLADLLIKYPPMENREDEVSFEDMSLTLEGGDISILIVFGYIDASIDNKQNRTDYYVNLQGIYIKYK